jgi:hypothetical protein
MLSVLIVGLIVGALSVNGVPYLIKGITGESHSTPFGKPASPAQTVVWGWLNLAVAAIVWHLAPMRVHPRAAFLAVALGVLVLGLSLANNWATRLRNRSS